MSDLNLLSYCYGNAPLKDGWETFQALTMTRKILAKRSATNSGGISDLSGATEDALLSDIMSFVPGSVAAHKDEENDEEKWYNAVRPVATLFVNLGLDDSALALAALDDKVLKEVHEVLAAVQTAVYQYEGAINKFLLDDKGSTLIACFGLAPNAHEDDAARAALAGLNICERLLDLGYRASVGITFGDVFCGVVGSRGRREYSILGDPVNLAARLMQAACTERGGVIVDSSVADACGQRLAFTSLGNINVKGKVDAIDIFSPYPPLLPTLRLPWQVSSSKSGAPSTLGVKEVPPQDAGAFASAHSKYGVDAPALGKVPTTSPSASPSDDCDDGNLYRHFHLRQLEIQATWRQLRSLQGYFDRRRDVADRARACPVDSGDEGRLVRADALSTGKNQGSGTADTYRLMLQSSSAPSTFLAAARGCGVAVPFSWSTMMKPAASQVGRRQNRLASSASFRESSATIAPPSLPPPSPRRRTSFNVPIEEEPSSDKTSSSVAGSEVNEGAVRKLSARKSFMSSGAAPVPPPRAAAKKPAFYAGQTTTDFLGDEDNDTVSELEGGFATGDTDVASLGGAIFGDGTFPHVARSPPLQTLNGLIPVGTMPKCYLADDADEADTLAFTDNGAANDTRTAGSPSSVTVVVTVDPELLRYGGEIEPFQVPINDHATFWDLFEASARAAVEAGAERVRRQHGRTSTTAFGSGSAVVRSMRESVATPEEAGYKAGHTGYSDDSGDDSSDEGDTVQKGKVEGDFETQPVRRLVAKLLKDAMLVVTGTRLLLPMDREGPIPLSVLPLFIAEALRMRSGLPQDHDIAATISDRGFTNMPGSNGRPIRVSFVRKASLPGLSSRAVAARTALLSAQCRLLLKHPSSKVRNGTEIGKAPKAGGLHLLTGPPGAGKSYLVSSSLVDAVPPRAAAAIFGTSYNNGDTDNFPVKPLLMRYTVAATPMVAHARQPGELPPPQRAAPWALVVAQYLDHRAAADGTAPADEQVFSESMDSATTDSSASDARKVAKAALARTTATRTAQLIVELQDSDPSGVLLKRAHVLNPFLSTSLESPEQSSGAPDPEEVETLLFALLQRLAAWRPSIVLIDDCHYLDQGTWRLSVAVATGALPLENATTIASNNDSSSGGIGGGLPLLCIMVGRPVAFRGLYQRLPPASLLAQSVATTSAQLDGLPSEVLEGVYLSALGHGVRALSGDLFVLLERTCLGVPGIALEFLRNLCAKGLLRFLRISDDNLPNSSVVRNAGSTNASIQSSYLADLSLDFRATLAKDGGGDRYLSASLAIKIGLVPISACRHLGAVADRLTSVQTLLLTTVAVLVVDTNQVLASSRSLSAEAQAAMRGAKALDVIGTREPDGSVSGACFPANGFSYDRLEKELLDLIARGILVDLTQSANGAVAAKAKADAEKSARRLSASSPSLSPAGQATAASLWSGNFVAPIERLLVGFARPFMAETVLAGMLGEHVAAVERQQQRNEEEQDKSARERMAKKMSEVPLPPGAALLHGRVRVRKSELSTGGAAANSLNKSNGRSTNSMAAVTSLRLATRTAFRRQNNSGGNGAGNEGSSMTADSDWKDRYLALINKKLVIFYSEKDYLRAVSGSLSAKDCTTIDLGTAVLDKDGGKEKGDEDDNEDSIDNSISNNNAAGKGAVRGGVRRLASSASASSGPKVRSAAQRKAASFRNAPTPTKEANKPNRVKVELEPFSSFRSDCVIALTSQRSVKNGKLSLATRTWYMEASSAADASKWIYLVRFVMEEAAAQADLARLYAVKQTPAMSKRARKQFFKLKLNLGFLRSFTRQWRFDSWGHARLAVSLRAARGVLNPHNLGVPHVYAKLCLVKTTSSSSSPGAYEVVSPVLVSPVSHPPSSSPSWEGLGPSALAFCPTFLFSKLDELALEDSKAEVLLSDLGSRVSAGLAPYALHVELWSAEQLVADESLGTALVPLSDLTAVDYSDRFDKSQPRIEEDATAAAEPPPLALDAPAGEGGSSASLDNIARGHKWRKLEAASGKFSSLIDPAVSAHAAVSLAVKLVVCHRPIFHADRGPNPETA